MQDSGKQHLARRFCCPLTVPQARCHTHPVRTEARKPAWISSKGTWRSTLKREPTEWSDRCIVAGGRFSAVLVQMWRVEQDLCMAF
eukprot:6196105-Pleurochrysis_carterae.AAC.1